MLPKFYPWYSWFTILSLLSTLAISQTTTSCNPTEKTCPSDTGLNTALYTHDFTTSGADTSAWTTTAGNVTSSPSGLLFTISKSGDAPTIRSKWYIFFGRVSFVLRSAPGTGIVSSAILQSDDLDEIDWEFLGGKSGIVETDYFGKGNSTQGGREADVAVTDSQTKSHNYTVTWTEAKTQWLIDGVVMRTLNYADALSGANYPQTPMDVRIGIWAGGDAANAEGTIEWAGGATDYSEGPFTMVLEKVEVENYNPAGSYTYGDLTGSYDSIKLGNEEDAKSSAPSKSTMAGASKTGTATVASATSESATEPGMDSAASASSSVVRTQADSSDGVLLKGLRGWALSALITALLSLV